MNRGEKRESANMRMMPSSCGSNLSRTICLFVSFFLHSFCTARGEFSSLGSSGGGGAAGQRGSGTSSLRSFRDEEEQLAGQFQCLGGFKKIHYLNHLALVFQS